MANTIDVFGFKIDVYGAKVMVDDTPLMSGAFSDGEIDANIQLLKDDLDAIAWEMKRAVRAQANKPDF
jgi:hypothetical protein